MSEYVPLLSALVALLVGLAVGKAWERYKLRDGKLFDRRRARESPHYLLGLNFWWQTRLIWRSMNSPRPPVSIQTLSRYI